MLGFRLRKEWILDVLGLGSGSADETQTETINVRLEEMFRESIRDAGHVIHLQREELEKLLDAGAVWYAGAQTIRTPTIKFSKDDGVSDSVMRELGRGPTVLAQRLQHGGRLVFAHAPVLQYKQVGRDFELCIVTHAIFAPQALETSHAEGEPKRLPNPDNPPRRRGGSSYSHDEPTGRDDDTSSFGDYAQGRTQFPGEAEETGPQDP